MTECAFLYERAQQANPLCCRALISARLLMTTVSPSKSREGPCYMLLLYLSPLFHNQQLCLFNFHRALKNSSTISCNVGVTKKVCARVLPSSTACILRCILAALTRCERQSDAFHLEKVSVSQLATASGHNHVLVWAEKSQGVLLP